jgi:LuxR family maltose regulon positive regulatory protein
MAALRLAQDDPRAATAALAPVLDGSAPGSHQVWQIAAFLLEASARDALGEREAAGRALERGLDLAEPAGLLFPSCCIRCLSCLNATRSSALCIPR